MEGLTSFCPWRGRNGSAPPGGAGKAGRFPENAPPIFFSSCRKENGPCTVQKKRRLGRTGAAPVRERGGPANRCGGVLRSPSSLRLTPAVEKPRSRIDGAADDRGGCRICLCFSFRAFRFAARWCGGRGQSVAGPSSVWPAASHLPRGEGFSPGNAWAGQALGLGVWQIRASTLMP